MANDCKCHCWCPCASRYRWGQKDSVTSTCLSPLTPHPAVTDKKVSVKSSDLIYRNCISMEESVPQEGRRCYLDSAAMHRKPNSIQPLCKCLIYNWYSIVSFGDLHLSLTLGCMEQLEYFYLLFQLLGQTVMTNESWEGMIYGSIASRCTKDSFVEIKLCLKGLRYLRVTSLLPCHNSQYKSLKLSMLLMKALF